MKFTSKDQNSRIIDSIDCINSSFRLIREITLFVELIKIESDMDVPEAGLSRNAAVLLDVELNIVPVASSQRKLPKIH